MKIKRKLISFVGTFLDATLYVLPFELSLTLLWAANYSLIQRANIS